jgi:hypothetical protein
MNPQIVAAVQFVITFLGGILASRGVISKETLDYLGGPEALAVIGSVAGAAIAAWGWYSRRPKGIAAAAANAPGVKAVIAEPEIANSSATPSNVVTSATAAAQLPGVPG